MKNLLLICFIVGWGNVSSQNCVTNNPNSNTPEVFQATDCTQPLSMFDQKNVKLYFHVWGGESIALLDQAVENLNYYFTGTRFNFFYDRCEVYYYENASGTDICFYKDENRQSDGINVHTIGAAGNSPRIALAESIPGKAILIGGKLGNHLRILRPTLAHEVGHCLGLFHTSHNSAPEAVTPCGGEDEDCWVAFDGSSMPEDTGDFVEDTNPDPARNRSFGLLKDGCGFDEEFAESGTVEYTVNCDGVKTFTRGPMDLIQFPPPIDNVMSLYGDCRSMFTECQAIRMHELMPDGLGDAEPIDCPCGEYSLSDESNVSTIMALFPGMDISEVEAEVLVKGTLTIDESITIPSTLNFFMAENAKIIVNENVRFTKDGGFIMACDQPFESIEVNGEIVLSNCDIKGANTGIYLIRSTYGWVYNVGVYDCERGIVSGECNSLTINGFTTDAREIGILAKRNYYLSITQSGIGLNYPESTRTGISLNDCYGHIRNCNIYSDRCGIYSFRSSVDIGGERNGNIIYNKGESYILLRAGIGLAVGFSPYNPTISYNQIANTESGFYDLQAGILSTSNDYGVDILNNTVIGNGSSNAIRSYGGAENGVRRNLILGDAATGILATNTMSPEYECNQISANYNGLYIGANSPTLGIITNHFEEAETDLFLNSDIGTQRLRGNWDWDNVEVVDGYNVSDNFFTVTAEEIEYPPMSLQFRRLVPTNKPLDLFKQVNDAGEDAICDGRIGRNLVREDPIDCWLFSVLDQEKQEDYESYWVQTYQFLRHYLGGSDVVQWPSQLWEHEPEMMTMLFAELSYRNLLNSNAQALRALNYQRQTEVSQSEDASIAMSTFTEAKDLAVTELVEVQKNLLSEVESDNEMFNLRRETFLLELKTSLEADQVTENDLDRLEEIADLCPDRYGDIVHAAEFLLLHHDVDHIPAEDPCPIEVLPRSEEEGGLGEIRVYPVPAAEKVTIVSTSDIVAQATLISVEGEILMRQSIVGSKTEIDVREFPSGIYFIEIVRSGQSPETHKIAIQR